MTRRILLSGLPPLIAALPGLILLVSAWDRLPETVASHFSLTGQADGTAGRLSLLALVVALPVLLAAVFAAVAAAPAARHGRTDTGRLMVCLSWATGVLIGGLGLLVVSVNLDAVDPLAAVLPGVGMLAVLAATVGAGFLGWPLTPASPIVRVDAGDAPVLRLGPTERASWSGRCGSWLLGGGGVLLLVAGVLVGVLGSWVGGAALVVAGLLLTWCSVLVVTVDRTGLAVGMGPIGFPRLRVPLAEVAEAHVEDVMPLGYGGWGLRFLPGTVAVVLRSGPAIVVTRRSGRTLVVTVDDAETAVGLLNGLRGPRERAC
jgi:MFS family permease